MRLAPFLLAASLCQFAAARAQTLSPTLVEKGGCVLRASAYLDPSRLPDSRLNPASRYDLELFQPANDRYRWDFVLPDSPFYPLTSISGAYGSNYQTQKLATIRATLRQFDTYDERVTFKDLDLAPATEPPATTNGKRLPFAGPRFLALKEALSITTPSGITVTLPASAPLTMEQMNIAANGNADALFVPILVTPNTPLSALSDSPLYRQHRRAVSLKLEVAEPNSLISYAADNTSTALKIGLPDLRSATHLDELTLIVRQRVDLRTVPVQFQVPISKPQPLAASPTSKRRPTR